MLILKTIPPNPTQTTVANLQPAPINVEDGCHEQHDEKHASRADAEDDGDEHENEIRCPKWWVVKTPQVTCYHSISSFHCQKYDDLNLEDDWYSASSQCDLLLQAPFVSCDPSGPFFLIATVFFHRRLGNTPDDGLVGKVYHAVQSFQVSYTYIIYT